MKLAQAWFELTADEQRAIALIGAIFLLGLIAMYWWHPCHPDPGALSRADGVPAARQTQHPKR